MRKSISFAFVILLVFSSLSFAQMESSYLRTDGDFDGFYLWFGGSNKAGNMSLAHEIIYIVPNGGDTNYFEAEIGPYFSFAEGKFDVCPMIGPWMNLSTGEMEYLLPQLYFYSTVNKLYFELWNIYYLGTAASTKDCPGFYGRYFMTYTVNNWLSIGPHAEMYLDLADDKPDDDETLTTLKVGAAMTFPYGKGNTMMFFMGIDNKDDNRFVARFTFTRYF